MPEASKFKDHDKGHSYIMSFGEEDETALADAKGKAGETGKKGGKAKKGASKAKKE